jgi:hypothetical protein
LKLHPEAATLSEQRQVARHFLERIDPMDQDYNVFVSWSGERSHGVAQKLRDWLPTVIQTAKPWMSDTDIEKGARWLTEIAASLTGIKVGIACLTPENLNEPWLLFEAGALSKTVDDKTRLCTYLLGGLKASDVKPPLGMFQHTPPEKEETRKLVHAINRAVSDSPVKDKHLDEIFDAMWPKLGAAIEAIPKSAPGAAPKREMRDMVEEILELVRGQVTKGNPFLPPPRTYPELGVATEKLDALRAVLEQMGVDVDAERAARKAAAKMAQKKILEE